MAISKVVLHDDSGADRTLVDLTGDTVAPETLMEGATAHDKAGNPIKGTAKPGSGGKQVQSDWAENDPQSPAYVKNRPFYDSTETAVIHPSSVISGFVDDGGGIWITGSDPTGFAGNMQPGKSYRINWDGSDYDCVCQFMDIPDGPKITYLGNPALAELGDNNGMPFLLSRTAFNGMFDDWSSNVSGESHVVEIFDIVHPGVVKKISKKFLPDMEVGKKTPDGGEVFNAVDKNTAGRFAHAEGFKNEASGDSAHAEGRGNVASGDYSHAEGHLTSAYYNNCHAEGWNTEAGDYSGTISGAAHAEGIKTRALGTGSHAEGGNRDSAENELAPWDSGLSGVGEVNGPVAYGKFSHAEGVQTLAMGHASHAGGIGTKANGKGSTVIGMWNEYRLSTLFGALFAVGNGTSNESRHDAFEVLPDGSVVLPSSTPGSAKYFKISVDDTGTIKATEVV